jgi:hypothetical protein
VRACITLGRLYKAEDRYRGTRMQGWLESLLGNAAAEALKCRFLPVEDVGPIPDFATGYLINARLLLMWPDDEIPPEIVNSFRLLEPEEVIRVEAETSEAWPLPDTDVFQ